VIGGKRAPKRAPQTSASVRVQGELGKGIAHPEVELLDGSEQGLADDRLGELAEPPDYVLPSAGRDDEGIVEQRCDGGREVGVVLMAECSLSLAQQNCRLDRGCGLRLQESDA
jgi:hypothetical protein